jgi:RNA recognition motif-containing protein
LTNIYVGNLPFNYTSAELEELFGQYGAVDSAAVIMDRDTGRSRGFGFVEMPSAEEANAAISALANAEIGGRTLTVNEAKPRSEGRRFDRGGGRDSGFRRRG